MKKNTRKTGGGASKQRKRERSVHSEARRETENEDEEEAVKSDASYGLRNWISQSTQAVSQGSQR